MHSSRETFMLLCSIPLYCVLIGIEILLSHWKEYKFYSVKSTLQNIYLTLLNARLDVALRALFYVAVLMWCYEKKLFEIENVYLYWFLIFLLEDLVFYFEHFIDHYCR